MSFIGIISDNKTFENIKNKLTENIKNYKLNMINITMKSIDNIKNVKFETIIIESELEKYKEYAQTITNFCKEAKYVIINTDLNENLEDFEVQNLITCGMNQNAIVTVSSNSEDDILIYWQKSIENKSGNKIEIEERRIKKEEESNLKIDEILILYTILRLYNYPIIEKI